jgi:hypothetical protein
VHRSERHRWVILESALPPPFSTGGARDATREITHAEDPRGSASQGRRLLQAPERGEPWYQRDGCHGMRAAAPVRHPIENTNNKQPSCPTSTPASKTPVTAPSANGAIRKRPSPYPIVIVTKNLPRDVREKLQQASRSLGRSLGWRGPAHSLPGSGLGRFVRVPVAARNRPDSAPNVFVRFVGKVRQGNAQRPVRCLEPTAVQQHDSMCLG